MTGLLGSKSKPNGSLVRTLIIAAMACIFLFDVFTTADNVSICFVYVIPIMMSVLDRPGSSFAYAGAATTLSIAGSFILPPEGEITLVFIGNRAIAVLTQWLAAALVKYRQDIEATLRSEADAERHNAEQHRRFLDILSHEINTPLTTIGGQAHRLIKLAPEITPDELTVRARKIRGAVSRIVRTIERIQLASTIGDSRVQADLAPVDLRALIRDVVENTGESTSPIEMDLEQLPERIDGDAALLRQALENLITNAMKFSVGQPRVRLHGFVEDGCAVISVSDKGSGIAAEDILMLGQAYYRGRNSLGVAGTGLGLHLVRSFVAAHGGSMSVDSRPGAGTTVTMRLPVSAVQRGMDRG